MTAVRLCTCGDAASHVVARRLTADGVAVCLWDDGAVTGRLGYAIDGVPIVRPRGAEGRARALRAGRLLMGEVVIHDASEVGALYAACRWVAERGGLPGDVRRRLADQQRVTLRPVWTVLSADRNGRPTLRVWRLPRLRWPGMAVWDACTSGRGGRYELAYEIQRSGTYESSGLRFATLAALAAHLLEPSS